MEYTQIEPVRKLLSSCRRVYIVGGALRDRALGVSSMDIDVVVDRDPKGLLPGMFPLDEERGIYRLIHGKLTVDVCRMQGETIEEDLAKRDFTVNAVALDLKANRLIDPLGGLRDAEEGILRATSKQNLKADPARLIRAVRLWLYLPLRMEAKTARYIKDLAPKLRECAPERVKEELVKILAHPVSRRAILQMERLRLLDVMFPEVEACTGLFQGKFFGADLKGHLIYTYFFCEVILNHKKALFPWQEVLSPLNKEAESGVKYEQLLKLSALLHDIGKPETFVIRDDEYTFWGHDKLGAQKALGAMKRLKFSSKSSKVVKTLVENHMRLHLLARAQEITQKAKGRFFRQLKEEGVLTVMLSLADSMASSGNTGFFYLLPYARQMLEFYVSFLKESNLKKPLLSGYEVMDILKIKPGPQVGAVLNALLEAQTEGRVKDKRQAVEFVREVFKDGAGGDPLHQGTLVGKDRG